MVLLKKLNFECVYYVKTGCPLKKCMRKNIYAELWAFRIENDFNTINSGNQQQTTNNEEPNCYILQISNKK